MVLSLPDASGVTPLMYACSNGNETLAKYILKKKVISSSSNGISRLTVECAVCHVTGNICSLVHSSPQTPKMIVICRAWSYFTKSCAVCRFMKTIAIKTLSYFTKSCAVCRFTSAFADIYKQNY